MIVPGGPIYSNYFTTLIAHDTGAFVPTGNPSGTIEKVHV